MKKRIFILVSAMIMLFAFSITASAEEDTNYIVLYDFDYNTLGEYFGGAPTRHTLTRVSIEDKGQIIYPIVTDFTNMSNDTYRPIGYFIVRDLACDLKLKQEVYNFETGEITVTESILNLNNHIPNYRDIYDANTKYYNYLKQFGFYPNNYASLNAGPLVYKSFALISANRTPMGYSKFTNYVDNDVLEIFFSDYSGDRKTSTSVTSLYSSYSSKMDYYDFIPYLHDNSTVKPISNPLPVTEPGEFPPVPDPEPDPEPLPPVGNPDVGNTNETIVALVSKAMNIIIANEILMILFCSGLLGVAFKIIMQAKKTSKL